MLLVSFSSKNRIEYKIAKELACALKFNFEVKHVNYTKFNDLNLFQLLREVFFAKSLVVTSPLIFCFCFVFFAKLLRKRVFLFYWDFYPVTLNGKRFDKSLRRRIFDWIEGIALTMCDSIVIPSNDFSCYLSDMSFKYINFWPKPTYVGQKNTTKDLTIKDLTISTKPDVMTIVFSGSINDTRGLLECYRFLKAHVIEEFQLIIASQTALPKNLEGLENLIYLGDVDNVELSALLSFADFGLVSLSKKFDGPAFPSKTFDYLKFGLPILYFGPKYIHYTSVLLDSGVGIELEDGVRISKEISKNIKRSYENKFDYFASEFCLNEKSEKSLNEYFKETSEV
ncbi:TPA: hypothetical protein RQK40_001727 [Vibrio vulnificus]|nr:hypothetical protein [Vibrio vulnificus]HDY7873508.1 hypothetical protein [Vibrio vulnificus]